MLGPCALLCCPRMQAHRHYSSDWRFVDSKLCQSEVCHHPHQTPDQMQEFKE